MGIPQLYRRITAFCNISSFHDLQHSSGTYVQPFGSPHSWIMSLI